MRRLLFVFLAVAALAVLPSVSQAAIRQHLDNGVINQLEDDDFETLINAGGTIAAPGADTSIDVGDFLVGMFRITALYAPPGNPNFDPGDNPGDESFTGIFAAKVTSVTPLGGGQASFSFTNASLAEWTAIGVPVLPTVDGTALIMFDDPDNIDHTIDDLATALATVDGAMLWEFGFDGDGDLGWVATGPDDVSGFPAFGTGGTFNAALNVTAQGVGPVLIPFVNGFFPGDSQLFFTGSVSTPGSAVGDGFDVQSDSDAFILPVPEPASMIVWTGMIGAGMFGAYRRRKAAKAAA
jgi:hypothetical protein